MPAPGELLPTSPELWPRTPPATHDTPGTPHVRGYTLPGSRVHRRSVRSHMPSSATSPTTHVVKQGEHIASIADNYGFSSWETVWDDAANAELRKKRPNPNTLLPGDKVTIPVPEKKELDCATEQRHRFVCKVPPIKLRLKVLDVAGQPISNATVKLSGGDEAGVLKTDASGMVERRIFPATHALRVKIESPKLPETFESQLSVGELDPIDTRTGQIARLNNLGYHAGAVRLPESPEDEERFKSAVEEFQCEEKISPINGKCEGATLDRLKQAHGC